MRCCVCCNTRESRTIAEIFKSIFLGREAEQLFPCLNKSDNELLSDTSDTTKSDNELISSVFVTGHK